MFHATSRNVVRVTDPIPLSAAQSQTCKTSLVPRPRPSVCRMNVDLLEVCGVALEKFNMRKAHRYIVQQGDPQMSIPLRSRQDVPVGRLVQDGLGRVPLEESRSCQFNTCQPRQILWPRRQNGILRIHVLNPNLVSMAAVRLDARPPLSEERSRLRRIRYATYDPPTRPRAMTAGVHAEGGSPTDRCEYSAPVTSNARPAKAHSLIRGRPGTTTATTPRILAVPRNG